MKRGTYFALACVATVTIACGDGNRNDNRGGTPGAAGTAGSSLSGDSEFVEDQLADGDAEVELGRLAEERATNPEVKEFARMMLQDHRKAGTELKQIASKHNVQPDEGEKNEHNDVRERLSKLSGREFDREYLKTMVEDHEEAVNEIEKKAEHADNPEVRQWASKTLPTIKQHLERAKQIQKSLEQQHS